MLFHPSGKGVGRIGDAGHLNPVSAGGDQERRQPAIHTHPATRVAIRAGRVLVFGPLGGLDVQRHSTTVGRGG